MSTELLLTLSAWLVGGDEIKALCKCAERNGGEKGRRLNAAHKIAVAEIGALKKANEKKIKKTKKSGERETTAQEPREVFKRAADALRTFTEIMADRELLAVLFDSCQDAYVSEVRWKNFVLEGMLRTNLENLEAARGWNFGPALDYVSYGADALEGATRSIHDLLDMREFKRLSVCVASSCGDTQMLASQKQIDKALKSVAKAIVAARKLLEASSAAAGEKKEEPSAEERRRMTVLVKSLMKSLMKSSVALFEALLVYFELTDDSQLLTCMLKQCKDPFMATEIRTLAASMKRFAVV